MGVAGGSVIGFSVQPEALARAAQPVHDTPQHPDESGPTPGVALCLSGGGYRAMLFHLGALTRLNELGYLPKMDRISSVSGGSITAGVLAKKWSRLTFNGTGSAENFDELVTKPLRRIAGRTIDLPSILLGLLPFSSVGDRLAGAYRRRLFGKATLQDLPDRPRFVLNATNMQSGALWRFSRPYMWDYLVGEVPNPTMPLSRAVAASSAFPPFLAPVRLRLKASDFVPGSGGPLQEPDFMTDVFLSDGGVYDNLGLETAWKNYQTVLISDGGGAFKADPRARANWLLQARRVVNVIDHQVRSLRKRQAIDSFTAGLRQGAYWGIGTDIGDYQLSDALPCPPGKVQALAAVPTRLGRLAASLQERLINWGYAVCDAALRKHVDGSHPAPTGFPYQRVGLG